MNLRQPRALLIGSILIAAALITAWFVLAPDPEPTPPTSAATPGPSITDPAFARISPELAAQWMSIEAQENRVADSTWAVEKLAASCTQVLDSFWDQLNAAPAPSRWEVIAAFAVGELIGPSWTTPQALPHAIQRFQPLDNPVPLASNRWNSCLSHFRHAGWYLLQTEFRHSRFDPATNGLPARSRFEFSAHFLRDSPPERAALHGPLTITWSSDPSPQEPPRIQRIDASRLEAWVRPGPPALVPVLTSPVVPQRHSQSVDPLIAHDLQGDGIPEFLLVAANALFRSRDDGTFQAESISPALATPISAAVLEDFNGDGHPDLLIQTLQDLRLVEGRPGGRFDTSSRSVWTAPPSTQSVLALTAGDFNGDGAVDVFLGQYKEPYVGGSTPSPFHNANDGYPCHLLFQTANGRFAEVSEYSGITAKRLRRMYSASFADLDADGDLDLLTVSDFAGLDLYRNDGPGVFTDVTDAWVLNPRAFGMAHSLSDFNADGRLDLLMIGMSSPTVDRLEHLRLWRPDSHQDQGQRAAMTHGNRLYLGQPGGGFAESRLGDSIARSGWSWGCASADFDNDGFPDVAIDNGLESRESVRDYESEYWLHDQHVGTASDDPAAYLYFKSKIARTRGRGMSYGGYEKNRLYLNQAGREFLEVGHLFGIALEQDCRNALAEDIDADGRVDLIVTSFEKWPDPKPTLRIFRNELPRVGNWIGFRVPGATPGTQVKISGPGNDQIRQMVAGDSYRSQHSRTVHFGLGARSEITRATVVWPSGKARTLENPAVGRYHVVH
jgi:hypothetical protein